MKALIFPGQGSQKKGMGASLFEQFKGKVTLADRILGYSIEELCIEDPQNVLGQTQYTQPALYIINAFHYFNKVDDLGRLPDFVAGHSLGEYNALLAAGAFDFETGLKLVRKRGELMSRISGGGMAAIVGLNAERVEQLFLENYIQNIDIANYNTPSQTVIAGPLEDIARVKPIFEDAGGIYITLKVSGAFHSRYMNKVKEEFSEYLDDFEFNDLNIPVISNIYAQPYRKNEIKANLIDQVDHPVKWTNSIRYLLGHDNIEIEEVGPGQVLSNLVKGIKKEAKPLIIPDKTKPKLERESQKQQAIIIASSLGSESFKNDYNIKYAYVTGAMYRGIASKELVVQMGKTGLMGYFGAGGLKKSEIEDAILYIKHELKNGQAYGINLLSTPDNPQKEQDIVDLLLKYNVKNVEAAAYISIGLQLVRYRAHGLVRNRDGKVLSTNRILAKVSRPEVAEEFLSPAPERIVEKLLQQNAITKHQAAMLKEVPMADDICAEADSGGHTDHGVAFVLLPGMLRLRDKMMEKYQYTKKVRVGAAGGIGTAEAAAAAFILGADFIVTGSINQCTVESGASDEVKDMLNSMDIQDTASAPAGDMFEIGARIQVLRKGLFFPARANKLYDLYRRHQSLEEIDENTKIQIQEKYFKRSFESIFIEAKKKMRPEVIAKAEHNPKSKMALIFKWYFNHTSQLALNGDPDQRVDYQIHTGPALGDFNRWVKGTPLEDWKNRNVDIIAEKIMEDTADILNKRFKLLNETGKRGVSLNA
ncbi:ACP S-malonyltransferase [Gracilibacillus sp. S3-1-1]|uniref:ACP S-malonyltransferase n=1 Tax=Gracilibacillus pellucidus TaxID=3095368 RepID=A0ACC6M8P3_9BACI|nr:ACP S-malonyltransferase [Gracilibacillus sp. S3-1-1]MDX8047238.1 ACP S-malonyltransferase [Gracilibacillus sp. S3-1-1]